ncbi:phosphonoacetaldehyde reductase [Daejeonella lutea]|uniref:Alcohol dehydrogenase n=1 Tax=Daejeonella lutea TaxID=572036 RepID=A0A1T5DYI3_9SPHI|nr:phosphonoacetaldehyde reductase [Daejeonella lutea]SKB76675.1 alcohol dehydrogenase [Daejeonella lutea]
MQLTELNKVKWKYYNPVQIITGINSLESLNEYVPDGRTLLITTAGFTKRGLSTRVAKLLRERRLKVYDKVTPNPRLNDIDAAAAELKGVSFDAIIALGGGSAMDFGKALSLLLADDTVPTLDEIFRKKVPVNWANKIPLVAIPTTSGSGSEVTPFATIWDSETSNKYSLTGELVFPTCAILDPELVLSLPAEETLNTALDSISHALESIWNKNRSPLSECLAISSLQYALQALPGLLGHPYDISSRTKMQTGSLLAGLAISQTRTAIAHSISYPLTLKLGIPHGLACGFTLTELIRAYLMEKEEDAFLTGLLRESRDLLSSLNLRHRVRLIAEPKDITALVDEMYYAGRADNFTLPVNGDFISQILTRSL